MVFDHISCLPMYRSVSAHMHHAIGFLEQADLATLPTDRHEIAAGDAYAMIQEYQTLNVEQARWESHRKYIDVQFIVAGVERMGHGYIDGFTPIEAYDETRDFLFHTGHGHELVVPAGMFAIFWPHDVHRPNVAIDRPATVRKVVVKLRVD